MCAAQMRMQWYVWCLTPFPHPLTPTLLLLCLSVPCGSGNERMSLKRREHSTCMLRSMIKLITHSYQQHERHQAIMTLSVCKERSLKAIVGWEATHKHQAPDCYSLHYGADAAAAEAAAHTVLSFVVVVATSHTQSRPLLQVHAPPKADGEAASTTPQHHSPSFPPPAQLSYCCCCYCWCWELLLAALPPSLSTPGWGTA